MILDTHSVNLEYLELNDDDQVDAYTLVDGQLCSDQELAQGLRPKKPTSELFAVSSAKSPAYKGSKRTVISLEEILEEQGKDAFCKRIKNA